MMWALQVFGAGILSIKTQSPVQISLVVPVFNEEATVDVFLRRIDAVFSSRPELGLEIIFVNDGSTDATLAHLLTLQHQFPNIKIIDLTRNFGKEAALSAGLQAATGQVVVPIDADLQDPPELIFEMLAKWHEGYEVVLARRTDRSADSWLKKKTAAWFYALHNKISDARLPANVGDFRLMDRKVVNAINALPETRRFMKGLFAWVGFRHCCIDYVRAPRSAGITKFNGWRLWNFALEGITSFSTAPLRLWTYLGVVISLVAFLFAAFIVVRVLTMGVDTPGYASLIVAVTFLGGLQLIGIGVLGEYLGRIYVESKRRPIYLVREVYGPRSGSNGSQGG